MDPFPVVEPPLKGRDVDNYRDDIDKLRELPEDLVLQQYRHTSHLPRCTQHLAAVVVLREIAWKKKSKAIEVAEKANEIAAQALSASNKAWIATAAAAVSAVISAVAAMLKG